MNRQIEIGIAVLALAVMATSATAHVTLKQKDAPAASYAEINFMVPHGCEGSPTIAIRVKIPPDITAVKPQMKAGWVVAIKTREVEAPAGGHAPSKPVDEVSWSGGKLPDNLYDTFGLQ